MAAFKESMAGHRASQWLRQVPPDAKIVALSDSVLGLLLWVKAGVGIAPLPTTLGDAESERVRLLGPVPALAHDWRLLAMPEIRKTARVSAFFDFVAGEIEALKPIITG